MKAINLMDTAAEWQHNRNIITTSFSRAKRIKASAAIRTSAIHLFAGALCISAITTCNAQVNKCVDVDGKVVFTDSPCLVKQKSSIIKTPGAVDSTTTNHKLRPEYAECMQMRARIEDVFGNGTVRLVTTKDNLNNPIPTDSDKKAAFELQALKRRYEQKCAVVAKGADEGAKAASASAAAERTAQTKEMHVRSCQLMRENLSTMRNTLIAVARSTEILTAQEKQTQAQDIQDIERRIPTLEKEIQRDCRN